METTNDERQFARVLWIGGAQWAGKTAVAQLLAVRHGLVHYAYDYHDARSHAARARAAPERYPHDAALRAALERDPDAVWVRQTPQEMARAALLNFAERFPMVLDDLRALPGEAWVVAEGWGLRPRMIAPLLATPRQAVVLVPSDAFRTHQLGTLARAARLSAAVSDPERAQQNRVERDRLLASNAVESAQQLGLRVIEVDGTLDVAGVTTLVEEHLRPHLPRWLYD